jgi:hypothetical protein
MEREKLKLLKLSPAKDIFLQAGNDSIFELDNALVFGYLCDTLRKKKHALPGRNPTVLLRFFQKST